MFIKEFKLALVDHRLRSKDGQAAVLIAAMMLTFFMFFALAINVGMLVNAKINLQNAADAAAYAGASVQARQLTTMSYLNYEMRRQYKKFLYRYYVVGGLSYSSMPFKDSGLNPNTARVWSPNQASPYTNPIGADTLPATNFGVPTICFNLASNSNPCQVSSIDGGSNSQQELEQFASDPINSALIEQLRAIEQIRTNNCSSISSTNYNLGFFWLYNTDPRLKNLIQPNDPNVARAKAVATLISGLGLIPSEFLLRLRMNTLREYLNESAKTDINQSKALALAGGATEVAVHERTIQAYLSALNSLGEHSFDDPEEIVMDELLPSNGRYPIFNFQNLEEGNDEPIKAKFDIFVSQFAVAPSHQGAAPMAFGNGKDLSCSKASLDLANGPISSKPNPAVCMQCNFPISVGGAGVPVGFVKDKGIQTYYAVRLEAPAKVLFNPFGGSIKLRAYSAAKPFGSRIGPSNITSKSFSTPMGTAGIGPHICDDLKNDPKRKCVGALPNLPIWAGESLDNPPHLGWNRALAQFGLVWNLTIQPATNQSYLGIVDAAAFERGYKGGMAPNPPEMARYNIPVLDIPNQLSATDKGMPTSNTSNQFNFQDSFTWFSTSAGEISLWAPLAKDPSTFTANDLSTELKNAFGINKGGTGGGADIMSPEMLANLQKGLLKYIAALKDGQGENHEGFNVVTIQEPFNTPEQPGVASKKIDMPLRARALLLADPNDTSVDGNQQKIKTAFVPNREQLDPSDNASPDRSVYGRGRNTYSVKFVTLNSLSAEAGIVNNPLPITKELAEELPHLQH